MPISSTVTRITNQELLYTPVILHAVQAAQASNADGETKKAAVLAVTLAAAQGLESNPNPNVAAIAALIDLTVSIFKATGLFSRKSKQPLTPTVPSV